LYVNDRLMQYLVAVEPLGCGPPNLSVPG
jgi:hypothetical protein